MKISLRHMGWMGENIRIDVWVDDIYAGDIAITPDDWDVLRDASDDGSLGVEVVPE